MSCKVCSKCGVNPRDSFGKRLHSWCKSCIAKDQAARRSREPEHAKRIRKLSAKRKMKDVLEKIHVLKDRPCMDCGIKYPFYVMHFDHRDPDTKIKAIATLSRNTVAWAKVEAEIAKCDLVCANCHAERTWNRKETKKNAA